MIMPKFIGGFLALVLALLSAPALAEAVTLKGSVTYRERIALPKDAWLTITLVQLPAAIPVVGASAGLAAGQVPIGFALNVRSPLTSDTAYGLVAEISSAGRVLFRNPVPVPVQPGAGHLTQILVNHAPQPVEEAVPPVAAPELLDIVWTVTSIGGRPVTGTRPLTLSIATDHRVGGSGGCNNYFTEAAIEGRNIGFGPAAATRMACSPDIMDQEAAYFAALTAVASYELDDSGLRLHDAAGIPLVGLVRTTE